MRSELEPESDEGSLQSTIVQTPWYLGGDMYGGPEDTLDPPDPMSAPREAQQTPPSFEGRRYSPYGATDAEADNLSHTPPSLDVRPTFAPPDRAQAIPNFTPARQSLAVQSSDSPLIDAAASRAALRSTDAVDSTWRGPLVLTAVLVLGVVLSVVATVYAYFA